MDIKYVVIVTDENNNYDCILHRMAYNNVKDANEEISNAKKIDAIEKWNYKYRVEIIITK